MIVFSYSGQRIQESSRDIENRHPHNNKKCKSVSSLFFIKMFARLEKEVKNRSTTQGFQTKPPNSINIQAKYKLKNITCKALNRH